MKIVHVVLNYYPSIGGTQWLFQNISERLVKSYGDDVTVLTVNSYYGPEKRNYKKIELSAETYNGVKIERFNFERRHLPVFRLIHKLLKRLTGVNSEWLQEKIYGPISASLTNRLNEIDADIVCGSSSSYSFMQYPLFRKNNVKPFVFMGAIHFAEEENIKSISSKTLNSIYQSEKYIANTSFEKKRLIQLGVTSNRIEVIGCGVDTKEFDNNQSAGFKKQLKIADDEMVFGFVGRHEPLKNIDILIEAFGKLYQTNSKIKLIIAGGYSWYTNELKTLINNSIAVDNIILLTNISESEKINLYHSIDVFVSASASESFGIVFIEAWACKKPVIGANVGSVNCVIDDEQNGLLFQPFNTDSLAIKMNGLLINQQKRIDLGNNGFDKIQQQYTWDVITEKYRNTYLQAIENSKK